MGWKGAGKEEGASPKCLLSLTPSALSPAGRPDVLGLCWGCAPVPCWRARCAGAVPRAHSRARRGPSREQQVKGPCSCAIPGSRMSHGVTLGRALGFVSCSTSPHWGQLLPLQTHPEHRHRGARRHQPPWGFRESRGMSCEGQAVNKRVAGEIQAMVRVWKCSVGSHHSPHRRRGEPRATARLWVSVNQRQTSPCSAQ